MNRDHPSLTRRDALLRALKGTVAAAVAAPAIVQAAPPTPAPPPEPEFVPENDYPFFGGDLPEAYREQR
jgi:hypothetical protein